MRLETDSFHSCAHLRNYEIIFRLTLPANYNEIFAGDVERVRWKSSLSPPRSLIVNTHSQQLVNTTQTPAIYATHYTLCALYSILAGNFAAPYYMCTLTNHPVFCSLASCLTAERALRDIKEAAAFLLAETTKFLIDFK